jgi:hypothetical protein
LAGQRRPRSGRVPQIRLPRSATASTVGRTRGRGSHLSEIQGGTRSRDGDEREPPTRHRAPVRAREAGFLAWAVVHGAAMLILDRPLITHVTSCSRFPSEGRVVRSAGRLGRTSPQRFRMEVVAFVKTTYDERRGHRQE